MKLMFRQLLCLVVLTSLWSSAAHAIASPTQGLQISPAIIDINAQPGQTINFELKLTDISGGALNAHMTVNDFGAKNEAGDPEIILDTAETSQYSMRQWVGPQADIKLSSQQTKIFSMVISVPKDAEPGGHYAIIRFTGQQDNPGGGAKVAQAASVGTLILMRVSGNISESLRFLDFYASKNGQRGNIFYSTPITFTQRLRNEGSVHEKPTGQVIVTNVFGKVVTSFEINSGLHNVLPGSIRRFDEEWKGKFLVGAYRAETKIKYGPQGRLITSAITLWFVPWRELLVLLGLVLFIGIITWLAYKGYRAVRAERKRTRK